MKAEDERFCLSFTLYSSTSFSSLFPLLSSHHPLRHANRITRKIYPKTQSVPFSVFRKTIRTRSQRGKFFPQLTNLVRINTPKAVQTETRKAFRKLPHSLEQATATLTNLKGVGTTLASGIISQTPRSPSLSVSISTLSLSLLHSFLHAWKLANYLRPCSV